MINRNSLIAFSLVLTIVFHFFDYQFGTIGGQRYLKGLDAILYGLSLVFGKWYIGLSVVVFLFLFIKDKK